ncbi:hypothetical protein LCGC14_0562750 [marine sediment metagenome]|uniref:DUF932 domain-containing protein n=1 Tax=marine sediment metagenome TaxID=412755 RepID=A0A0F9RRR7_9ZZZZ
MTTEKTTTPVFDGVLATTAERRAFAEKRMHEYIQHGVPIAQSIVNKVLNEVPNDQIAKATALNFKADDNGITYRAGDNHRTMHRNALGQLAVRAGIPIKYLDHLMETGNEWKQDLLAHTLNQHFHNDDHRYLLRSVGDETRAVLSDKYKRIDCRPVLDKLIASASKAGALVVDGATSAIRSNLKFVLPTIFEPVPGEFVVWGLSWTNSDFGRGANELNIFFGRVWCWNGMVGEKAIRQIHLGRRLGDDIAYSERTLQLDTDTAVSAVADVANHYLNPDKVEGHLAAIASAHNAKLDPKTAEGALAKRTSKATAKSVVDKFNSADVIDLPQGQSDWRWANAISLVARDSDDGDRKIDLERLAGDVLTKHGLSIN